MADALLEVRDLRTYIYTRRGVVKAVDGATFTVHRGETLGIVGESGSGKSMTCLSILRLVPEPGGRIVGGEIVFDGEDLVTKSAEDMRRLRGSRIAMILQDPMASLNPALTVGEQIRAVEHDLATDDATARLRHQSQNREARHRFAGAGFADDAERLASTHGEARAVDRLHDPAARVDVRPDVADLEQRVSH